MFSLKLLTLAGALAGATAFAPMSLAPATRRAGASSLCMQQSDGPKTLIKQTFLTPTLFKEIDVDENGTVSLEELKSAVKFSSSADVRALIQRGDLNGDGVIDYPEYERLMNMEVYGDAAGGNFYVRQALDLGLLSKDSPLADCVMVGNKGFDPLNLAKTLVELDTFREAEIKHGRLAMLAAVGWPAAERLQPYFAKAIGAPSLLVEGGKAPSLLNGGLENINPIFFAGILAFTAFVETEVLTKMKLRENRIPGDLGFDPLGLYMGKSFEEQRSLELKELQNGRLAMIGIVGYVAEEFVSKFSVVAEAPLFEKSVEQALGGV